ncbi:MAG: bifunctional diguanylate cyclase/phosphodiesterase [Oceanicaulis sp.]|mgnify:CR=1 FL=1|uniref:putative bifunctional diguanylate cyclase/phosphodiesterase n=1 Tax=Oceanicaulis sp. UBA6590 TaxID=1947008 RepID=UPI000C538C6C|nr:EAL domain-containing protein [Oceanicaulis sp. UBA6590]MBG34401.1 bifunctional diguanylate cyclase/phosphodiesterase [Oceanicaulis sp.]
MRVLTCLAFEHHLPSVLLAGLVCVISCLLSMRLLRRSEESDSVVQVAWLVVTATCLSAGIWSTHFIAMLGYRPSATVSLQVDETALSALIIMCGALIGCYVATLKFTFAKALAGSVIGVSVTGMHYAGMMAYNLDAIVAWDMRYVIASVVFAVFFGALAFEASEKFDKGLHRLIPGGLLAIGVVSLHFTGMGAMTVVSLGVSEGLDPVTFQILALTTAVTTLVVVGAGGAGYAVEASLRERTDRRLRHLALHDIVTDLPNRACFTALVEQAIENRKGKNIAVLVIDLNRFKEINDVWGHQAGDAVLCDIADRLRGHERPGGYAARLGGDEFGIVFPVEGETELVEELKLIESLFMTPVRHADFEIVTNASLGVAVYPEDGRDCETLMRNADLAMYKAKTDPLNRIQHYEHALGEAVRQRRELAQDLRTALETGELRMFYQPQIDLKSGEVCGYEALVRWPHPVRGMISPAEFVPLAEANGLIGRLGDWVLETTCEEVSQWPGAPKVAINLSAIQLNDPHLVGKVLQAMVSTGLSPSQLEIELTETALIHDLGQSLNVLRRIKALGVSMALDDFGTGYSALETLRRFPFDKIKLDKGFTDGLSDGGRSRAVISAVVTLAHNLDIPVLAEGVETADQLDLLNMMGCEQAQGYLIGRPAPSVNGQPPAALDVMWRPAEQAATQASGHAG